MGIAQIDLALREIDLRDTHHPTHSTVADGYRDQIGQMSDLIAPPILV